MRIRLWGTRGSVARAGPGTVTYGGDTASVEVSTERTVLALDAGSGIVPFGDALLGQVARVDVLLTHLHMDHIQGLGFFRPLFDPGVDVHIWGTGIDDDGPGRLTASLPVAPAAPRPLTGPRCDAARSDPGTYEIGDMEPTVDLVIHPSPPSVSAS